jgi:hypothetical protein
MHPLNNPRSMGVRMPENQSTEAAPTMKVTNVAFMQPVLLEWGNERGLKETSVAFVCGGKVYVPPQYKMWTEGFRPLVDELGKQVIAILETRDMPTASIPSPTVDIVSPPTKGEKSLVDVFEKEKVK